MADLTRDEIIRMLAIHRVDLTGVDLEGLD